MSGLKTYIGIVIALAPTVAGFFGYTVTENFGAELPELADQWMTVIGLAIAAYGRSVATAPGWFSKR